MSVKKEIGAIRKACGVRSGPLTPWERLKILSYANTLADDISMKERDTDQLRANLAEMERLQQAVKTGEMTEAEACERAKNLREEPIKSTNTTMNDDQLNTEIGRKLLHKTKDNLQQQRDFVDEVQNAKMALELTVSTFRKDTLDFLDEMGKYLTDVRQTKMALGTETKQLLAQCQDVRTFFLSPEHASEVQRLKEFVEVCERLKALRDSGFLDSVADTILKLSPA